MVSRTPGRGLRGVAAVVAQSELSNESPVAWVMLLDQLGRTLRAISAAHVARGETEMAIALVEHLEGELVALHDQFTRSRDEGLAPDIQRVWEYDESQEIGALERGVGLDLDLDLDWTWTASSTSRDEANLIRTAIRRALSRVHRDLPRSCLRSAPP